MRSSSARPDRIGSATRRLVLLLSPALFVAAGARAEVADTAGDPRFQNPRLESWTPVLNVEIGVHAQTLEAEGETSFGARDRGTNTVSTLLARLEAAVATPPVSWIPATPRVVLRGGASFSLRETSTISSAQRLDDAELGTEFFMSWKEMWHVGLDLRYVLPIPDHPIVLQPGIEYLQSHFRFEPLFTYRAEPGSPEAQGFPNPRNPPTLEFKGRSGADVQRFVGPALAVEGHVIQFRHVRVSAYLQGRCYWLLGDRVSEVSFEAPLLDQQESASARMEANALAGQVGFGIRGSF